MVGKSRTRIPREVREQVDALAAARDALDAEQAERRKREDAAFERYAQCAMEATAISEEREAALAELGRQHERVERDTSTRLDAVEARRRAVLVELNSDGRSADDLATMFAMPVKRIRTMLRAVKTATTTGRAVAAAGQRSRTATATAAVEQPVADHGQNPAAAE